MSASRHRGPSASTEAWTADRLEALTELWLGDISATQIAARLGGVSRSAVLGKVHRLGLGRPAPAPPRAKPPRPKTPRRSRARVRVTPQPAALNADHMRREVPQLTRSVRTLIVAANGNIYVAPPPTPLPPLRMVEVENPRSLLQLGTRDCHHPINDGDDPRHGFLYCGEPVTGKGDYCARCRTILFDHERTAMASRKTGHGRAGAARTQGVSQ